MDLALVGAAVEVRARARAVVAGTKAVVAVVAGAKAVAATAKAGDQRRRSPATGAAGLQRAVWRGRSVLRSAKQQHSHAPTACKREQRRIKTSSAPRAAFTLQYDCHQCQQHALKRLPHGARERRIACVWNHALDETEGKCGFSLWVIQLCTQDGPGKNGMEDGRLAKAQLAAGITDHATTDPHNSNLQRFTTLLARA